MPFLYCSVHTIGLRALIELTGDFTVLAKVSCHRSEDNFNFSAVLCQIVKLKKNAKLVSAQT